MSNYIQVDIKNISKELSEILVAELSEINYDAFQEGDDELSAFIKEEMFDEGALSIVISKYHLQYLKKIIAKENWNQKWESDFHPIIVNDFVAIRTAFHEPINAVKHEIIITPKMSFGTGHHATTFLMLQQMEQLDFVNKDVLDFGTGTGVLAILAEKLGANKITAIDIDEWSIENSKENVAANQSYKITLLLTGTPKDLGTFDIILANINLDVIISNLHILKSLCKPAARVLVSGFLTSDKEKIMQQAKEKNFEVEAIVDKENWLCILLVNREKH